MLDTFPAPMNINLLKKILSNANINFGNFNNDIVEQNIGKADIQCWIYLPFIHQAPKLSIINKDANINVGNIP